MSAMRVQPRLSDEQAKANLEKYRRKQREQAAAKVRQQQVDKQRAQAQRHAREEITRARYGANSIAAQMMVKTGDHL